MRLNPVKKLVREGGVALGIGQNQLTTTEFPRMAAAAGFDWLFLDAEHGPFTTETLQEITKTCLQTPVSPILRVADFQYDLVARALDGGAEGIIFPRVESPDVLRNAVSWAKFPPRGVRGFGLGAPQVGYQNVAFGEIIRHMNDETLIFAQIESVKGLEARHELAAVEGLDSLFIGPADLSISLGVGGQWDHPKLLGAIDEVVQACNDHGKMPAIHVRNAAFAKVAIEHGMKVVSCAVDLALLWAGVQGVAKELRG
ncbi:MAG: aldolase [Acidobacteria bacterium]|nr:aldolase [Acidobacteriota bacterium]